MSARKDRAIKAINNRNLQLVAELEKVSPGLGGLVLNESEMEGIPPEEVIAKSIQFRYLVQKAVHSRLTVDQLLATFDIWDSIYRRALQSSFITAQLFSVLAQVFSGFMELYSSIYSTAKKASDETADAEVKKEMLKMWKQIMESMQQAIMMTQQPIIAQSAKVAKPYTVKAEVKKEVKKR